MKAPAIKKSPRFRRPPNRQRGVTILLVAAALVAIMAMAALSIDAVTLYLANANAQEAADAAALAAARVLSLSGMTGDPKNNTGGWAAACTAAQNVATAIANRITVGGALPASVTVTFPNDPSGTCNDAPATFTVFGVNPQVQVRVQSVQLPTFFARIWGKSGSTVGATATAEAFNPSDSGDFTGSGNVVPVQPRCVKPWIVPNSDPGNPGNAFVAVPDGSINNPGVSQLGAGVIGESFLLKDDCGKGGKTDCLWNNGMKDRPPGSTGATLDYIPARIQGPIRALPSCVNGADLYQQAIGGCDQTAYACGTINGASADLSFDPGGVTGDTATGVQCLTNYALGQDSANYATFPFQLKAGAGSPLVTNGLAAQGAVITSSNSIATLPIYDSSVGPLNGSQPNVTIVGFLQVFIDSINANGDLNVHVLNVSGCSNNAINPISGTSPVPVRLITNP